MSKELKKNLLHALFVGIICGIVIAVYASLPVEAPLYWACFIMIPVVFMFGGQWKDVPVHWINVLIGLFLGGALTFVITQALVPSVGLALAFGIATCVCTFLVQGLTNGVLSPGGIKPFIGRCPMAFVGMITCFAAGGENYVVAVASLLWAWLPARSWRSRASLPRGSSSGSSRLVPRAPGASGAPKRRRRRRFLDMRDRAACEGRAEEGGNAATKGWVE